MNLTDNKAAGREMHALAAELYPFCRSITGDGVRLTLRRLAHEIPLELHEVPSGTQVFDWTVPEEWNIREAWIKDPHGRKVVDFANHNLHVVGYSTPVREKMPLSELKPRLFSLPEQPDLIPYRTSYYKKTWGFCLPHQCVRASGRGRIRSLHRLDSFGREPDLRRMFHSRHHRRGGFDFLPHLPSFAGERQSRGHCRCGGPRQTACKPVTAFVIPVFIHSGNDRVHHLARAQPGGDSRIKHGLVLTCAGDAGPVTYKKSRHGNAMH